MNNDKKLVKRQNNIISEDVVSKLATEFSLPNEITEILAARGFDNSDALRDYINADKSLMHNPLLITDMVAAVNRIKKAIKNKEQITIWGDYDVDGVCASSILYLALKEKTGKAPYVYLPERKSEGYGLNMTGAQKIVKGTDTKLLITVDCGITSKDVVEYVQLSGVDVIVTDHHEVPDEIPYCTAVVDLKRKGEKYPFTEFCGAGVALKTVEAVFGREYAMNFVDIAAFATVADLVPLKSENRIIVKEGLKLLNNKKRVGMQALINEMLEKPGEEIKAHHFGFRLGPAINACGRLSNSKYAFKLMTTDDEEQAQKLAVYMHELNEKRKEIENSIKEQSFIQIERNLNRNIYITYGDAWEAGVVGIVASRITEKYNKPSIVFSYDRETGIYKGSARSIPGINIYQALKFCDEHILKWGGHEAAAGLSVEAKHFFKFVALINSYMDRIDPELFVPLARYDAEIILEDIDEDLINNLSVFEPTGLENPGVNFLVKDVEIINTRTIGTENNHFSCDITDGSTFIRGLKFNDEAPIKRESLNIVFKPQINEFLGEKTIQLMMSDILENNEEFSEVRFNEPLNEVSLNEIGVIKQKETQFNNNQIFNNIDLTHYLPRDHIDYRKITPANKWEHGENYAIQGTVLEKKQFKNGAGFFLKCRDDFSNIFLISFFHQDYLYKMFYVDKGYFFSGKASIKSYQPPAMTPSFWSDDFNKYKKMVPIYRKIRGMSNEYLETHIKKAIDSLENNDYLSKSLLKKFDVIPQLEAIKKIHAPNSETEVLKAQERFMFDELFKFGFYLTKNRIDGIEKTSILFNKNELTKKIEESLPYKLTKDQKFAVEEISRKTVTGERLHALIQGDVGCGKTIVALLSSALAAENGYQACIIAPTEVLASQHFLEFKETLEPFGITVASLTGSTKAKEKRQILKDLKEGTISVIVGTHALLQDAVEFNNIGLLVIDEQHKFGVVQREKIEKLESAPHVVAMSATPIPRTLTMAFLGGHIDVINIKTKPAGRKPIITSRMDNDEDINDFMLSEIKKGHQCYVVCPLIDESESETMKDVQPVTKVVEQLKSWANRHKGIKVSDITGKMKKKDIEEEIQKFKNNETQILVSTTIVEVGVNVPNATVMVLKNSERFGLAQAHQLRGRVGRGNSQGYFILQTGPNDEKAKALIENVDGFDIAEADVKLRGSGDLLGTVQSGKNFIIDLIYKQKPLFEQIQQEIDKIAKDPEKFKLYETLLIKNPVE